MCVHRCQRSTSGEPRPFGERQTTPLTDQLWPVQLYYYGHSTVVDQRHQSIWFALTRLCSNSTHGRQIVKLIIMIMIIAFAWLSQAMRRTYTENRNGRSPHLALLPESISKKDSVNSYINAETFKTPSWNVSTGQVIGLLLNIECLNVGSGDRIGY